MGLTIHYSLTTEVADLDAIRSLVGDMRDIARQLPFQEVSDILEYRDEECRTGKLDDEYRWLKIQAGRYVEGVAGFASVTPRHIVAFMALPGDGCEPANLGLCFYPASATCDRSKKKVRTNLTGWSWSSCCKTQYASLPDCGGVANFVRCHLAVITLLGAIRDRGLAKIEVSDESDYWDHRDVRKLAATVGEWNEMVAAVAGQIKDAAQGLQIVAPILKHPQFEHLEARGRDKQKKPTS